MHNGPAGARVRSVDRRGRSDAAGRTRARADQDAGGPWFPIVLPPAVAVQPGGARAGRSLPADRSRCRADGQRRSHRRARRVFRRLGAERRRMARTRPLRRRPVPAARRRASGGVGRLRRSASDRPGQARRVPRQRSSLAQLQAVRQDVTAAGRRGHPDVPRPEAGTARAARGRAHGAVLRPQEALGTSTPAVGGGLLAMISENYRALNEKLHRQQHAYGCSGSRWADLVLELARGRDLFDALDYGCGKQTLAGMIGHVIPIRGYDPAIPHLSERPAPADLVTCTDVMEHVEPEHIDAVLDDVASLARKAAFFVISLERGGRKLPDG